VHAFDHPAVLHVQAGHDFDGFHDDSFPFF
jgi:hypothetical protein